MAAGVYILHPDQPLATVARIPRGWANGWTVSLGYQYPFSTQPHDVRACRSVSHGIQNGLAELAEIEPGLESALGPPIRGLLSAAARTPGSRATQEPGSLVSIWMRAG